MFGSAPDRPVHFMNTGEHMVAFRRAHWISEPLSPGLSELRSLELWNWQTLEWEEISVGPMSCDCDACHLLMAGQHDSPQIRNRLDSYRAGGK